MCIQVDMNLTMGCAMVYQCIITRNVDILEIELRYIDDLLHSHRVPIAKAVGVLHPYLGSTGKPIVDSTSIRQLSLASLSVGTTNPDVVGNHNFDMPSIL